MDDSLPSWLDGGQEHAAPLPEPARRWAWLRPERRGAAAGAAAAVLALALALTAAEALHPATGRHARVIAPPKAALRLPPAEYSPLSPPPAWPGALPYPLLIADEGNHRLVEVAPDLRQLWQYPPPNVGATEAATSATFAPEGTVVVATGEQAGVVAEVDFYSRKATWVEDAGLDYPSDGHALPNGAVVVADVRDCRVLTIDPRTSKTLAAWGLPQSGYCRTDLASGLFGYPNGVDPQADGSLLVSLSDGGRVALLSATGAVVWDAPVPSLGGALVSAARLTSSGDVLVTGLGTPGAVLAFNPRTQAVLWEYDPASGAAALADPRVAIPLPNGDVAVADSGNNRVVVIDPRTGTVMWQYRNLAHPTGLALDVWRDWRAYDAAMAQRAS